MPNEPVPPVSRIVVSSQIRGGSAVIDGVAESRAPPSYHSASNGSGRGLCYLRQRVRASGTAPVQQQVTEMSVEPDPVPWHRRLFVNTVINGASLVLAVVVGFFLTPFLVHHLGVSAYGLWGLLGAFSVSAGYLSLADLGLAADGSEVDRGARGPRRVGRDRPRREGVDLPLPRDRRDGGPRDVAVHAVRPRRDVQLPGAPLGFRPPLVLAVLLPGPARAPNAAVRRRARRTTALRRPQIGRDPAHLRLDRDRGRGAPARPRARRARRGQSSGGRARARADRRCRVALPATGDARCTAHAADVPSHLLLQHQPLRRARYRRPLPPDGPRDHRGGAHGVRAGPVRGRVEARAAGGAFPRLPRLRRHARRLEARRYGSRARAFDDDVPRGNEVHAR